MVSVQESPGPSAVRVLLVDDDALVRRTLAIMLESCGYEVLSHNDGTRAQEVVEREGVQLVVLDVMMPKLCGLEVCRRIKRSEKGRLIPVVLLTALGAAEDVLAGFEAGADEFLTKPVDPAVLEARLRALLRFQAAQQGVERKSARPEPSLPQLIAARVSQLAEGGGLSPRERQVLDLLLLGRTMEEIGLVLEISPRTAKFHQANVLEKMGAESRLDLLRLIL